MEFGGKRYIIYKERKDRITVWNLSDLHLLSRGCDLTTLRKDIQAIAEDPYSFWFGGGDYADYIAPSDKRFDPAIFVDDVKLADLASFGSFVIERVATELWPIQDKCLGLLYGNHESKYQQGMMQEDLHERLCESLGTINLGYSAFIDVCLYQSSDAKPKPVLCSVGETSTGLRKILTKGVTSTFRFFLHHGVGYATTRAGKLKKLSDVMRMVDADVYMIGHVHDKIVNRESAICANTACTNFVERPRYGLITGGYLNTYVKGVTTYGEIRMYTPTYLGPAKISLQGEPRNMSTIV